ncbi:MULTISPECIES: co-chaperone GroES [Cetobacterium]|jgi:chaperonin GroES|uniref:10 kDa chaperonin n=1 Tax=Candidatus Cetobacterium colombiensis TaxID=3073100 RepID=A0ABU4W8J6_9FUSO|nr:co-chaperone GroES [Candidatus Cetobacterium colombiensis]MDX8335836.1 co-chaperone GroES [Candidatus Cetobacterium colombiensis]
MKIKPIGKRVLIQTIEVEETTSTGIILIQNDNEKNYKTGKILALSEDSDVKSLFSINDKIIFSKRAGIKILDTPEEKILLELDDILGIIE